MYKQEIRSRLLAARNSLSAEEKSVYDKKLQEKLFATQEYQKCSNLFCYVSFKSEIDTHEIIKQSLADGKRVYVPRVEGRDMEFYQIEGLCGLVRSKFGVPEPGPDNNRIFSAEDLANFDGQIFANLMLLPGLAFDLAGNRIGYGAGYYDRYLQSHRHIDFYRIALAYDFQLIDRIEVQEHDVAVNMIITPTKIIISS